MMAEFGPFSDESGDGIRGGRPPVEGVTGEEIPGPEGDDPLAGFGDDLEEVSATDRDLVEPGLDEAQLALADLGTVEERDGGLSDETGTGSDDEAEAAAGQFEDERSHIAGSEPAELPGASDGLFDDESDVGVLEDGGKEGFADGEDLVEGFEESARSVIGDTRDEETGWVPDRENPADPGRAARLGGSARLAALPPIPGVAAVAAVAAHAGRWFAWGERPDSDGREGVFELDDAGSWRPWAPSLGMAGEEAQRVSDMVWASDGDAPPMLWVATERGMIFRRTRESGAGPSAWVVERTYRSSAGRDASWLPLGVARAPFRLVSCRPRGGLWAWRPGGPLLRMQGDGLWRCVSEDGLLRAFAADPVAGAAAAFVADDEGAEMRIAGAAPIIMPLDAAEVVGSSGACAALRGSRVWIGCSDPAAPLLRSDDGGRTWRSVRGAFGVRAIVPDPGGDRVIALGTEPGDESDVLLSVPVDGGVRVLARDGDLAAASPSGPRRPRTDGVTALVIAEAPLPVLGIVFRESALALSDPFGPPERRGEGEAT